MIAPNLLKNLWNNDIKLMTKKKKLNRKVIPREILLQETQSNNILNKISPKHPKNHGKRMVSFGDPRNEKPEKNNWSKHSP